MVPCSVKAYGGYRRPPRLASLFEVTKGFSPSGMGPVGIRWRSLPLKTPRCSHSCNSRKPKTGRH